MSGQDRSPEGCDSLPELSLQKPGTRQRPVTRSDPASSRAAPDLAKSIHVWLDGSLLLQAEMRRKDAVPGDLARYLGALPPCLKSALQFTAGAWPCCSDQAASHTNSEFA